MADAQESMKSEITALLHRARGGDKQAVPLLINNVYDEVRRHAAALMRNERADHTLQPTALVNEALARLLEPGALDQAVNRKYFFGAVARAMQQILIDHARQRAAAKRGGGGAARVPLDDLLESFEAQHFDVIGLDAVLRELAALSERQAEVVRLRFFCDLTMPEIAEQLDMSLATVENDWRVCRAFLRSRLGG